MMSGTETPRKAGNWHDYSMDDYQKMCVTALDMHLEEVKNLQDIISNEDLEKWREGRNT